MRKRTRGVWNAGEIRSYDLGRKEAKASLLITKIKCYTIISFS